MGVKMTETKTEIYLCKCGRDYITLEKSVNSRLRSSIKKENYSSIIPCSVCVGMIDENGRDLCKIIK